MVGGAPALLLLDDRLPFVSIDFAAGVGEAVERDLRAFRPAPHCGFGLPLARRKLRTPHGIFLLRLRQTFRPLVLLAFLLRLRLFPHPASLFFLARRFLSLLPKLLSAQPELQEQNRAQRLRFCRPGEAGILAVIPVWLVLFRADGPAPGHIAPTNLLLGDRPGDPAIGEDGFRVRHAGTVAPNDVGDAEYREQFRFDLRRDERLEDSDGLLLVLHLESGVALLLFTLLLLIAREHLIGKLVYLGAHRLCLLRHGSFSFH